MAVRSRLPWPWRAVVAVTLLAIVAGMWWWGFDFGQFLSGFNRQEIAARVASLESDTATLREENALLRSKNMQQESELAMMSGAQASLSKQALELQTENSQIKEELVFLQKLVADSNKQIGLSIQRLIVEREREDAWHYSLLLARGGNPKDEFIGYVTLQVTVLGATGNGSASRPTIVTLPDEQPGSATALKLNFKYYQRLEGTVVVPKDGLVKAVTVRAFETGQTNPRATRNLVLP